MFRAFCFKIRKSTCNIALRVRVGESRLAFHAPCDAKDLVCLVVGERQKMAPCPHGESMSFEAAVSEL